ncbi:MAG: glycogen/starch/alpha-glucan phosphorylase [Nitrospirota bacterium]|nr:glycogen/starch/alpha-glucan phosphorylase [Nitrospirota bacterium]
MNDRKPQLALKGDYKSMDMESLVRDFANHMEFTVGKDAYTAKDHDQYKALAHVVRDRITERWMESQRTYYRADAKRIYYLSLEFLIGRLMGNSLINLGFCDECFALMQDHGVNMEAVQEQEPDAGLGNGGLGRLAACFLDSMATLELPAYGYGIRYEYGIFNQHIVDGHQVESPDNWLRYGNPWEFPRPEVLYPVKFYGRVYQHTDGRGVLHTEWVDTDDVMAMAYDTPIPGYMNNTAINMRLWAAKSSREFNLSYFNDGDYIRAVGHKNETENISKVLYPNDNFFVGKELRLKQEYFFVSATLQDIIRRYIKDNTTFDRFHHKVAIQLNDTHPAIAIPELMRVLMDQQGLGWDKAWDIAIKTFGYTNHTILPEALEKWPVDLFGKVLPRHLQIIYEINHRFLKQVEQRYPGDADRLRRMSIIEEGDEKRIRMANLAIVGSRRVNGVAALHTELLKAEVFRDFYELYPDRFVNMTNGITPRRWLKKANPALSALISGKIGGGWVTDLDQLKKLVPLAKDRKFRAAWQEVKRKNKEALADYIFRKTGTVVNPDSLFDCQVKRLHEYKRQLLNVLHVITLYNRIRSNPAGTVVPRTVIFSGKAAPGYWMAKKIIKLINSVADVVNNDPVVNGRLKVVFLQNYNVSLAERIIPAADLSEQISTAGTEASGTGNMKFALNGALTIGTLDGANVEIREEVGEENIFIFGLNTREVAELKAAGYNARDYYNGNAELRQVLDMIAGGYFSPSSPDLFAPIVNSLLDGDQYLLLADYASYVRCQEQVAKTYLDQEEWTRMAILNVAHMGKFSSDRTIKEYAREIWQVKPIPIEMPENTARGCSTG